MATAAYTTDLTDLTVTDTSETTANWQALGGGASGLNVETDYFLQGTNCISKNAWAGANKGMIEDTTNNTLTASSDKAVYTWVTHATPGSLAAKASGGINIIMGDTNSNYNEYYYAGSDTIDYGAPWICAVIHPDDATPSVDQSIATTAIDCYGALANLPSGGPTKGSPFGIDVIRYGRTIEISGGDGADPDATFTGVGSANDATSARWGQFQRTPGSTTNFTMQCRLEFGKTSATSSACTFTDSNKNIAINDLEFTGTGFVEFDVTQGSTVDISSCNFTAASSTANTRGNWVTTSATSVSLDGCNFTNMGTFGFDSTYTVSGCTFRSCDLVTANSADLSGSSFINSTSTSSVLWNTAVETDGKLDNTTFTSDGSNHAIEFTSFDTDNGTTLRGCTFNNYAAADGSTGNETIYVNIASGTYTISAVGCSGNISVRTAGATVTVEQDPVTIKAIAVTGSGTAIQNARVFLRTAEAGTLPFNASVSISNSGTTATVTHTAHGLKTNDKVVIYGATNNENLGVHQITVTGTNTYTYTTTSLTTTDSGNAYFVYLEGLTDVNGEISASRVLTTTQAATGTIRKATSAPYYKPAPLSGDVSSTENTTLTGVMIED